MREPKHTTMVMKRHVCSGDRCRTCSEVGRRKRENQPASRLGAIRLEEFILMLFSSLLRYKVYEPILVVGPEKLANIDIRLRVKGGGHVSQLYALRQAIAKGVVASVDPTLVSRGCTDKQLLRQERGCRFCSRVEEDPCGLRPIAPCCRPQTYGTKEVRWTRGPSKKTEGEYNCALRGNAN